MVIEAYARQLPAKECGFVERYTRSFNYPETNRIKTSEDLDELGIKTFFASNVCCAYRRDLYFAQGGFIRKTIFNEDMIFAGKAIQDGYAIAYAADAKVIHSHNYTSIQQFKRNFDLAVSQADHPEIFDGIRSESEGIHLVKTTACYLIKSGKIWLIPELVIKSGFKYLGYRMGKRYQNCLERSVMRCTMNPEYWEKEGRNEYDDYHAPHPFDTGICGYYGNDGSENPSGKGTDRGFYFLDAACHASGCVQHFSRGCGQDGQSVWCVFYSKLPVPFHDI